MRTSEKPDWDEYVHSKCTFSLFNYEIFQMYEIAHVLCLFN